MTEKAKRFVVSLNSDMEAEVAHVQKHMQDSVPGHLRGVRVSKSMAVEAAIKHYIQHLESTDEQF